MADDKDAELARRCAKGDAAAWASLVERYHRRFVQVAYRTVGDHDAAEDLAQEAFVQIYLKIHTFRAESCFLTWAYQVLMNLCLMHLRSHQKDEVPLDEMTDDAAPLPSPEEEFFRREEARWIQDALAALPPQPRMALSLRAFEEMECDEIAAVMGVPLGTVLSWIHRGRVTLRKRLQSYCLTGANGRDCKVG